MLVELNNFKLSESISEGSFEVKIFEPCESDEQKLKDSLEALSELYKIIKNENRSSD